MLINSSQLHCCEYHMCTYIHGTCNACIWFNSKWLLGIFWQVISAALSGSCCLVYALRMKGEPKEKLASQSVLTGNHSNRLGSLNTFFPASLTVHTFQKWIFRPHLSMCVFKSEWKSSHTVHFGVDKLLGAPGNLWSVYNASTFQILHLY